MTQQDPPAGRDGDVSSRLLSHGGHRYDGPGRGQAPAVATDPKDGVTGLRGPCGIADRDLQRPGPGQ